MIRVARPRRPRRLAGITVVMPCYRYGRFLPAAVRSVLTQPGVDARVIIVDDASPDDSGAVARSLAAHDSRVRAVVKDVNSGHIATYNTGLALVETEFATLVSADDVVAPGALGRAVALMQRRPRVGLVYGAIATIGDRDIADAPTRTRPYHLWRIWRGDEWIDAVARSGYNPIASPEAVIRTAALRQVGGYTPSLPHSGDLEYWLRIAARWDVGQIHGPVQAYYRVHGANMHLTDFGTRAADLRERLAAFRVLADPATVRDLPSAPAHLARARASLAAQVDELIAAETAAGVVGDAMLELRAELAADRIPATSSLSAPSASAPSLSAPSLSAPSLSAPSLSAPSLSEPSRSLDRP